MKFKNKRKSEAYRSFAQSCRSPLNMGHDDANLYPNFWNLNQTFYLKGVTTKFRFNRLLHILRQRCPLAVISEDTFISGVRVIENPRDLLHEIGVLKTRGEGFRLLLDKMRLQMRYAFMALLSQNRVSLYNDTILMLMSNVLKAKWNDRESSSNFCAFLLDKMHFKLDPQARPYENLINLFKEMRSDLEINEDFNEVYRGHDTDYML